MRTWSQCVLNTALGKTAATYNDIGTLTIRKGVRSIHGFYLLILNTKPTADEASSPMIRVNSSDLGVSNMNLHGSLIGGEGYTATQAKYVRKVWYPWSPKPLGRSLEFANITLAVTGVVACTEGFDCGIQLITADAPPTAEMQENYKSNNCGPFSDGDTAIEAAGAGDSSTLSSWGTADVDMIVINSKNNSIVGINYTIGMNAETEAVPLCNYAELTCSDIDNFTPQQHLVQYGASGSLGTTISSMNEVGSSYLPFVFDGLPGDKVKISIADINSLTGLTAGNGLMGMVFK